MSNNFAEDIRNALNNIEKDIPFLDNLLNLEAKATVINTEGKLFYPEVILKLYNPDGVGIALNSGGIRAFNSGMGFLLGLLDIEINGKNALTEAKAIASTSGGSWLIGSYFFAKQTNKLTNDDLLGRPIPVKDISLLTLDTYNFDKSTFLGYTCTEGLNLATPSKDAVPTTVNNIWINSVSKVVLRRYGIDSKIVAFDETYAKTIKKNNPDINEKDIIIPPPDYPFWICDASILYDPTIKEGSTVFPMTTIYSGFPQILSSGSDAIGGNFIETYGYGCKCPSEEVFMSARLSEEDLVNNSISIIKVSIPKYQGYFTLDYMIGISSAAYGYETYQIAETDFPLLKQADIINPLINMWCNKNQDNTNVVQGVDGYISGNGTGIISLLARGQKKIICFITPGTFSESDPTLLKNQLVIGSEISSLYGRSQATNTTENNTTTYTSNPNSIQVFERSKFDDFVEQVSERIQTGSVAYAIQKLRVLPNYRNGVEGNYEVKIIYIISQPTVDFNKQLPEDISFQFVDPNSPYYQFPNYPIDKTFTRGQINLLLSFCYYLVHDTELNNIIKEFYLE